MLKYIRLLLFPIALLYGLVVRVRNYMFNIGQIKSHQFPIPIISIGNITVGGTGKTPLTEFVIKLFQKENNVALLSRGYKRDTKGVVIANNQSTVSDIGDEPKQIKDKFANIIVAVAEKRIEGINELLKLPDVPNVIVMDDAYQHRYVKPGLSILVIDYNRLLWKDTLLPAGELREPMGGKRRADVILFSKCPSGLSSGEQDKLVKRIKPTPQQQVYFSSIRYQLPKSIFTEGNQLTFKKLKETSVLVVTGIANPSPFLTHVKKLVNEVRSIRFSDHHQFSNKNIQEIRHQFLQMPSKNRLILTTEKDAVRFKHFSELECELKSNMYYIPIEIEILNQKQEEFKEKIITYVNKNKRNR